MPEDGQTFDVDHGLDLSDRSRAEVEIAEHLAGTSPDGLTTSGPTTSKSCPFPTRTRTQTRN